MINMRDNYRMQLYLNTFDTALRHEQHTFTADLKAQDAVNSFDKFFHIDNDLDIPKVVPSTTSYNEDDEIPF